MFKTQPKKLDRAKEKSKTIVRYWGIQWNMERLKAKGEPNKQYGKTKRLNDQKIAFPSKVKR